jgi:hypothetical protein
MAQLVVVPEARVVLAAFANSAGSAGFHTRLQREVLGELLGVSLAEPWTGEGDPAPAAFFAGSYGRRDVDIDIAAEGTDVVITLTARSEVLSAYAGGSGPTTLRARSLGPHAFGFPAADGRNAVPLGFAVGASSDHPAYVFVGGRLSVRLSR